ncbi:MAG: hypothetical protein SFX72_22540 [Isosphaeraceae bacterium]|nr:hypothetical protein [Isosphaeraceae bacterium]
MVALSFPLWTGSQAFPRVPTFPELPDLEGPPAVAWFRALALLGSLVTAAAARRGFLRQSASLVGFGLLAWSFVADIERLQPWAQHAALALLASAALPADLALVAVRAGIISIYLYSGASKLDHSFATEIGPLLLGGLLEPLGIDPMRLGWFASRLAVLSMPLGELLVGILLMRRRTRAIGVVGSVIMHATLIAILNPWNLGHSGLVSIWNALLAIEVLVVFGAPWTIAESLPPLSSIPFRSLGAAALLSVSLIAPAFEPLGWVDPWPAHALYAGHVGRVRVLFGDRADDLPEAMRSGIRRVDESTFILDLTAWSRSIRGVPVYPGIRANLRLASQVAPILARNGWVRIEVDSRAARLSGRRSRLAFHGLDEIARARHDGR